jgi:hypothetical protein
VQEGDHCPDQEQHEQDPGRARSAPRDVVADAGYTRKVKLALLELEKSGGR